MWGDSDDETETAPTLDAQEKAVKPEIKANKEAPAKNMDSTSGTEDVAGDAINQATESIQAAQGGNQVRKEVVEKQEAAAKIQAVQRGNQVRKEIAEKQEHWERQICLRLCC